MRRAWSRLAEFLSCALEPDEREAVLGDIEESQEGLRGLFDVLGLVVRRQAALWMNWQPWLVLIGLVVPFAFLLALLICDSFRFECCHPVDVLRQLGPEAPGHPRIPARLSKIHERCSDWIPCACVLILELRVSGWRNLATHSGSQRRTFFSRAVDWSVCGVAAALKLSRT